MIVKRLRKIIGKLLLMFCMLKKKKHIMLIFQNITQSLNKMIANQKRCHYLAEKQLSALLLGITSKHYVNCHCSNCLHSFRTKNLT